MKKYIIIGGQYEYNTVGESNTLHGAKIIASKHLEYWDNWQGWHYPAIYRATDVQLINNFYGEGYAPKLGAMPVASRVYGKRWVV